LFFSDISRLKAFNLAYDQRIEKIESSKSVQGVRDTLYLHTLPYTKSLMSYELRGGLYYQWQEEALEKFYETPFPIKLLPPEVSAR